MRKFIRHPSAIPIEIAVQDGALSGAVEAGVSGENPATELINISAGGLAFNLLHRVAVGAEIVISLPQVWPDYSARGTVVWCRECSMGFEAGVQFAESNEAFKARMVAQFCQIEDYRRDISQKEGRRLSSEEAAKEWIVQYAEEFADTIGWQ